MNLPQIPSRFLLISLIFLFPLVHPTLSQEQIDTDGCFVLQNECKNHGPPFVGAFVVLEDPESKAKPDIVRQARCVRSAQQVHAHCGNPNTVLTLSKFRLDGGAFNLYHPQACEEGWWLFGGHCYKHFEDYTTVWEAERLCEQQGAHLASIHSELENHFAHSLCEPHGCWIGLQNFTTQNPHDWQWTDKTGSDETFSNFASHKNELCDTSPEDPLCANRNSGNEWFESYGTQPTSRLCKKEARIPTHLLQAATYIEQPMGVQQGVADPAAMPLVQKDEQTSGAHQESADKLEAKRRIESQKVLHTQPSGIPGLSLKL
eukprot:GDKI01003850.1.p1 GENE.GDKI01003850.1~~GDKI01003850.1.p1  ORF type:complete len:317 (-),score=61.63 GDKI01003850.1:226-1176(-)